MTDSARDVIAGVTRRDLAMNGTMQSFPLGPKEADAILTALRTAGFAVVPTMPTERMELAGDEDRSSAAAVWFNMISAAQGGADE